MEEGLGGEEGKRVLVKIVGDESFSFNIGKNEGNKRRRKSIKCDGYIWLGKLLIKH